MRPWLPIALIASAYLASRLVWTAATGFAEDDAFITFRYAEQLAAGNGFVYNPGERVYGTSTPLFAWLLAGWAALAPGEPMLGARAIGLAAGALGLVLLDRALVQLGASGLARGLVAGAFVFSPRLALLDSAGMETPLALGLLSAAWYAHLRRRPTALGVLSGLLVLTRPDLGLWALAALGVEARQGWRSAVRVGSAASATVLPWLLFSWGYFGSPIPHTVAAKYVAYVQFGHQFPAGSFGPPLSMLFERLRPIAFVLAELSPFAAGLEPEFPTSLLPAGVLLVAVWQAVRGWRVRELRVLSGFLGLLVGYLLLGRATFFPRYFAPGLWSVAVLLGLGLGELWARFRGMPGLRPLLAAGVLGLGLSGILLGLQSAEHHQRLQRYRHEASLVQVGRWLNRNAPAEARVLLEPLGHIGYYADRVMLDEVGLVTPSIVELKRQGVLDTAQYIAILAPDYVILHCDDSLRMRQPQAEGPASSLAAYRLVQRYNPLGFDPEAAPAPDGSGAQARNACYEIWAGQP